MRHPKIRGVTDTNSTQPGPLIRQSSEERGIERLCHFTQLNSLELILQSGGLWSRKRLSSADMRVLANDPHRIDGHEDHISLSITYPNAWVLDRFVSNVPTVPWIILLFDPSPLWWPDTLFSPANAARGYGSLVCSGPEAFEGLFAQSVSGRSWPRSNSHCKQSPTDAQAEVLVQTGLSIRNLNGIVSPTTEIAQSVKSSLERWPTLASRIGIFSCREFFEPNAIKVAVRENVAPVLAPFPMIAH